MISQIVRLDAPYNIICSKSGQFGLHIATLIVVKEKIADATDDKKNSGSVTMENYPIVNTHNMDGQTWKDTELKDCLVICRQGGSIQGYGIHGKRRCCKSVITTDTY